MNVVNVLPMPSSKSPLPPPPERPHLPVLAAELLDKIAPRAGGVYVDATLGAGGHTDALLQAGASLVIGIDRDETAIALARERLASWGQRVSYHHGPFSSLADVVSATGVGPVDGLIADLGVSSMQLGEPDRGMSFRAAGPLDMRMDRSSGRTALELIAELDDDELSEIIHKLGEERRARRVARCIKQDLQAGRLNTTLDLRRSIVRAVGPSRSGGVDPATRTFQALRMAVNEELRELDALLEVAPDLVAPGGVLAVISFHSLEDRVVKRRLRDHDGWELLNKKPIVASDAELDRNRRARSAKLRAARRLPAEGS